MTSPEAEGKAPLPVTIAGRFRIVGPVAAGGFSRVFRGVDGTTGVPVAIKLTKASAFRESQLDRRLSYVAEVARVVGQHPNGASVYATERTADNDLFMVEQLIDGRTLREVLREQRRLTLEKAASVIEPLLDVVSFMHDRGFVHRDLKPENIIIDDSGTPILVDFDLAGPLPAEEDIYAFTPSYAAPEVLMGQVAGFSADIYALGTIMYEMLTGVLPFASRTEKGPGPSGYLVEDFPRLSQVIHEIPSQIDHLISAATERDPSRRLANGRELLSRWVTVREELNLQPIPVSLRQTQNDDLPPIPNTPDQLTRIWSRHPSPVSELASEAAPLKKTSVTVMEPPGSSVGVSQLDRMPMSLRDRVLGIWAPEVAETWLSSPSVSLGGARPVDLIDLGNQSEVESLLQAMEQGAS
jgi:eukaryotic-like serine/threonine-protein kinase